MRSLALVLLLFFHGAILGQTWILEKELPLIDSNYFWTSDEWGQLYQWKNNTIWLQQNLNSKPFQETYKTLGEITAIQPINGLRALVFSEGQQLLGIVNNTLQLNEELLALYDINFSNVSQVSVSIRPDFIWLFDQYRERLVLFQINTAQVVQVVDNCFGGLNEAKIIEFFEYQQNLNCLLSDGRYFKFDRNLTLVQQFNILDHTPIFGFQQEIWMQNEQQITKLMPLPNERPIELPLSDYEQLQVLQDRFYFQQGKKIKVYRLKM